MLQLLTSLAYEFANCAVTLTSSSSCVLLNCGLPFSSNTSSQSIHILGEKNLPLATKGSNHSGIVGGNLITHQLEL